MPVRVLAFCRMRHNSGWGTRSGGFAGQGRRNPMALLPYVLGGVMLATAVMIGV